MIQLKLRTLGLLKLDFGLVDSAFSFLLNPFRRDFGAYYVDSGDLAAPKGVAMFDSLNNVVGWDAGRVPYKFAGCKILI